MAKSRFNMVKRKKTVKRYSAREKAAYWFGVGAVAQSEGNVDRIYKHGDAKTVRSYNEGRTREYHNAVSQYLIKSRTKRR